MLPQGELSTQLMYAPFQYPDIIPPLQNEDYEYGGIGLQDPSRGLMYQVWTLRLEVDDLGIGHVLLSASNYPETEQFSAAGITDISLTFDQNMNPVIAFYENGQAKLWWYDLTIEQQTFTTFPAGTGVPKCTLDDKRASQTSVSDVLVFYTKDSNLYYRQQRDRYATEYLLHTGVVGQVLQAGMNKLNRMQIVVGVSL